MGDKTPIEWCDSTVNGQMGCDGCELWLPKADPPVRKCYADVMHGLYATKSSKGWPESFDKPKLFPHRIEEACAWKDLTGKDRTEKPWLNGYPRTIFLDDMGDTFTESLPLDWLMPLIPAMEKSPHLWLMLTKRASRMYQFFQQLGYVPANFWPMTSITSEKSLPRLQFLMQLRGLGAKVLGVSYEPVLGPVDWEYPRAFFPKGPERCCNGDECGCNGLPTEPPVLFHFDWIIVGGASGTGADPCDINTVRRTINQCKQWHRRVFVKQLGTCPVIGDEETLDGWPDHVVRDVWDGGDKVKLRDSKGGDISEWHPDLRVREMPEVQRVSEYAGV